MMDPVIAGQPSPRGIVDEGRRPARPGAAAVVAVVAMWAPFLAYALAAGDARLVRFFPDDAFYYLQPAANAAAFGRATFDGVHVTNGFQPLNFLLVTAIAWVTGKAGLLAATFVVDAALVWWAIGSMTGAWMWQRPLAVRLVTMAIAALPPTTLFIWLSMGMEAALVVWAVVLLARTWSAPGPPRHCRRGVALAALLLARLDLAVAVVPFALASASSVIAARRTDRLSTLRGALETWGIPVLALGTYLLVNVWTTGHALPISVYVKLTQADAQPRTWAPSTGHGPIGWLVVLAPLVASTGMLAWAARREWTRRCARGTESSDGDPVVRTAALLNAGVLLYYAYLALAVTLVFRWYFALPLAALMVDVVVVARHWSRRQRPRHCSAASWPMLASVTLSAVVSLAVLIWIGSRDSSTSFHLREISRLVSSSVEPQGAVAVADAGAIGFFTDRRVVNVDGLANDYEFVDEFLRRGRLVEYFRRERVTHYLVRDTHLANRAAVLERTGEAGAVIFDRRLVLSPERELFRYEVPGQFTTLLFRVD